MGAHDALAQRVDRTRFRLTRWPDLYSLEMDPGLAEKFHIEPPVPTHQHRFLNRVKPLIRLFAFARAARRARVGLPLRKRLRAWRLGFFPSSYLLYDLDRNNPLDYLPDTTNIHFTLSDSHHPTLSNKLSFSRLMQLYAMPHPEVLGTYIRGQLHLFERSAKTQGDLPSSLQHLMDRHGSIVLKPNKNGQGRGIIIVKSNDHSQITINGVCSDINELVELMASLDDYYLSSFILQARYCAEIYAETPNTIRVLTLWDYDKDIPFVAAAVQRIGTNRSYPVDNFHQGSGGLGSEIDGDSGRLGPALTVTGKGQRVMLTHHPESGQLIEGLAVPHWQQLKQTLLDVASKLPQMPYVGWDLIVTEEGFSCIEANCPPGVAVWQAHTPLLVDSRARRCFETLGMI